MQKNVEDTKTFLSDAETKLKTLRTKKFALVIETQSFRDKADVVDECFALLDLMAELADESITRLQAAEERVDGLASPAKLRGGASVSPTKSNKGMSTVTLQLPDGDSPGEHHKIAIRNFFILKKEATPPTKRSRSEPPKKNNSRSSAVVSPRSTTNSSPVFVLDAVETQDDTDAVEDRKFRRERAIANFHVLVQRVILMNSEIKSGGATNSSEKQRTALTEWEEKRKRLITASKQQQQPKPAAAVKSAAIATGGPSKKGPQSSLFQKRQVAPVSLQFGGGAGAAATRRQPPQGPVAFIADPAQVVDLIHNDPRKLLALFIENYGSESHATTIASSSKV